MALLLLCAALLGAREWSLRIGGMHCIACTLAVKKALLGVPGVRAARVNFKNESALVTADESVTLGAMQNAVAQTGYTITAVISK
ncbi:MAG: heavy-metal-associated domain-containing protein [Campylobacterales bacterium]|nr:heavy-metal-associated domain-containing protein [Campylobacterales bacterium]